MTEDAMRQAFIGKTLDGHYVRRRRLDRDLPRGRPPRLSRGLRSGTGRWFFRGQVFCTFYDPGPALNGGCWTNDPDRRQLLRVLRCRPVAGLNNEDDAAPGPLERWDARGLAQ